MILRVALSDERDILELYRRWTHCNVDTFHGDWARVPRHLDSTHNHTGCDYLECRRFRMCKSTGQLYLHPHAECRGTYDQCPFATEVRSGDIVCAVTGMVLGPPRSITAESLQANLWAFSSSSSLSSRNSVSRQDVERMTVDSPFFTKKPRQVASFESMAGKVRAGLLALVHNILAECFILHNKSDAPLVENLACAFFFHTRQNISAFRRVTAAFLRVLCTHSPESFPQLPPIRLELFNVRNWRYVVGCEQKSITQTEKRVLDWLQTFRWTGEWLIRPDQIRESERRYTEMLERCVAYESVSADQLMPQLLPSPSVSSSLSSSSLIPHLSATTKR